MDAASCAFAELYSECRRQMVNSLLRRGYNADAEDIVQNAFMSLWVNWDRYDHSENLAPLAWGYLNNLTFKSRRKKKRHPEVLVDEYFHDEDESVDVAEQACSRVALENALESLELLPSEAAQAILLRTMDYSYDEVGEVMGMTRKKVSKTIYEGRKQLRELVA